MNKQLFITTAAAMLLSCSCGVWSSEPESYHHRDLQLENDADRAIIAHGTMFLLWFLLLHSPRVVSASLSYNPNSPNEWSTPFIALGMCGAAWISAWHSLAEPTIASVSTQEGETVAASLINDS